MTPTPQTDEMELAYAQRRASIGEVFQHACELERELAELKSLKGSPDGGPAFPMPAHHGSTGEQTYPVYGMSLRDWFAGQATDSDIDGFRGTWHHPVTGKLTPTRTREQAKYAYADAMLKARTL